MRIGLAAIVLMLAGALRAHANYHQMLVREVYAGGADPTAQYVMLQMYAVGQTQLTGHTVTVYDAAGANPQPFAFTMPVANGASQATVLVGTASVTSGFGVTPDLIMGSAALSAAGGKACFDTIPAPDCVAWGAYAGSATGVGNPVAPSGIPSGMAIRRKIDDGANPAILDIFDDHDDSATDFELVTPNPIPNSTPVSSTTTTSLGGGGTTSSTASPTTTTLPCPATGVDGALCLLDTLPPQVCRGTTLPRKVRLTLQAATNILRRAQTATGRRHDRLVRKAAKRLGASTKAIDAALARGGKITPDCAGALQSLVQAAHDRLTDVLPAS